MTSLSGITAVKGTLTKTGSSNSFDAGGISTGEITGVNQGIEFKASQTSACIMIGLTTSNGGPTDVSYWSIDFAMYVAGSQGLHVYQSGIPRGKKGTYTTSDVLQVRVNSAGKVEYLKNGT